MELRITGYDHPDAEKLTAAVQQEYVRRYGDMDLTEMRAEHFVDPQGIFVVGYLDGAPVACGGWRVKDGGHPHLRDGDAELKRMFVVPAARGRGLSRTLLRHLEELAGRAGRRRLVLETGTEQPEAVALYESEGYLPITKFGIYRDAPECICLGKELSAA
ncbi:GNAT family N-acetyltransferase [Kitasatospora sp. NBC_01287]|uniref:GNAT family N-acetyltransferase n=1 Tax=Kitasatospora sp. NBC_01287 TaxID=2903573 RepID=UPI00224E4A4A|nr:GNAT family N-acetyltransferase [Kitasatospora sp. NBC_01287]MCX4744878.1 GNAT family N-acetyltransferase [Kitasatospora sp. NBC_01287]